MQLLDEIIELLADEDASLNAALLKTKVLMHTIGHAELTEWVNDELNGYATDKQVPSYRIVSGRVAGNIQNAVMLQQDINLPTHHLPENLRKWLEHHELREAMSVLQEMGTAARGAILHMPLSPVVGAQIDQALNGYWVQKCWVEVQPLQIKNGITQVRSRLLDFALNLKDKIGGVEDREILSKAASTDVPGLFHGAVFGNNATVVVGNENRIRVSNQRGDFQALANALMAKGISEDDIAELRAAVSSDEGASGVSDGTFGPSVKAWMAEMLRKAVNASWQIELGIAGNLLTDALKAYYF